MILFPIDKVTGGASSDLNGATGVAEAMVKKLAMSENLGMRFKNLFPFYSNEILCFCVAQGPGSIQELSIIACLKVKEIIGQLQKNGSSK